MSAWVTHLLGVVQISTSHRVILPSEGALKLADIAAGGAPNWETWLLGRAKLGDMQDWGTSKGHQSGVALR